jgi:glycosyltransferase involved in cell wall biosynthesis
MTALTSEPRISVVIGVYNDESTLNAAVQSVLSQEGVALELIAVDDGSTDASGDELERWSRRDSRVSVVRRTHQGLTRSLVAGCLLARGEYIARQDSDDVSLPGRLRRLATLLNEHDELVMASSWTQRVLANTGDVLSDNVRKDSFEEATRKLTEDYQGPPGHGSVMFRRAAYLRSGGYREEFYFAQDLDLWLRLSEQGHLGFVQDYLYRYPYTPDSISSRNTDVQAKFAKLAVQAYRLRRDGKSDASVLASASALRSSFLANSSRDAAPGRQQSRVYYSYGMMLRSGNPRSARRQFLRAIKLDPLNWRAWLRLALLSPSFLRNRFGKEETKP